MIVAFLGPSLPAAEARGFEVLPPARQGDVWRALRLKPRAIALIDGVFESQPSVWHHEILDALDAGVAVFGGASMGALRAAELQPQGMVGVGRIFRWYRDGTVIDDAEVALLHGDAEHGFVPLTVPLVNVRWAAEEAASAGVLKKAEARALVGQAARTFYQDRTWPGLLRTLPPAARQKWTRFRVPDLKADDAREVLSAARLAGQVRPAAPRQPAPSSLVRRRRAQGGDLWRRPDARALADAGLRRALLAGWARELGLQPTAAEVRAAGRLAPLPDLDAAEAERLHAELALERLVLDHAERFLNDGPSAGEALVAEARLRGLGAGRPLPKGDRTPRATRRRRPARG